MNSQVINKSIEIYQLDLRGLEFASYEIELQNLVTQNDVIRQATNSSL